MSPTKRTFPTWEELYGRRPKFDEIKEVLSQLNRLQTVLLLSQVSIHLALDRFHNDSKHSANLQGFLISNLIPDDLLDRLKKRYPLERLEVRTCFHRWQVLTLLKWALVECPATGGADPDKDQEAKYNLGRSLVMTNDLLMTQGGTEAISRSRVSEKRRMIALQLQLGSTFELNNPPSIEASLVRTDMMFGEVARKVSPPLDVKAVFAARTGLQLDTYVDMVFGLLTYYLTQSQKELIEDPGKVLFNPETFFRIVPGEDVRRFLSMELGTIDETGSHLRQPSALKPQHDFIAFRKKPLLQLGQMSAICINPGFLQEKVESGLFWSIFNSLATKKERDLLFQTWGMLFEEYVSWLLAEPLQGKAERYIPFPKFTDNDDEAFDGVVVSEDKLFVMEYKGGFLKAEAKYAENENELIDDLRLKFGTDPRAGVGQLARKIGQVFNAKDSQRRKLRDVDSSTATLIVPVMVVQEPFVSSHITSIYLRGEFRSALRLQDVSKRVLCTGLQILDVGEIEGLRPYLRSGQCTFGDCLMGWARLGDKAVPFHEYFAAYFREKRLTAISDSEIATRARKILDRISTRFFGHPLTQAD